MVKLISNRSPLSQFNNCYFLKKNIKRKLNKNKIKSETVYDFKNLQYIDRKLHIKLKIMKFLYKNYYYELCIDYISDKNDTLGGNYYLIIIDKNNLEIYKKNILPFELDDDVMNYKERQKITNGILFAISLELEIDKLSQKLSKIDLPSQMETD